MSLYQFLASNKPLKNMVNPYIEFISINQMIERGMEIAEFILDDTQINREEKIVLICDSEEHLYEIQIKCDDPNRYARDYTDKKYISEITWHYTQERAQQLLEYIRIQMELSDEIELWNTWMDDVKIPFVNECKLNELTIDDIKNVFGKDGFKSPECLRIKK